MERIILFNMLQVLASAYAMLRGGAPERLTGGALLVAAVATRVTLWNVNGNFVQLETGVVLVDLALLAALLTTTLYADRYWTFWLTAMHALGAGAHLVKAIDPGVLRAAYGVLAASWSYPMLVLLVVGTYRHRRRVSRFGSDLDWSLHGR